jgi:uncharacterized lipoprotein NlpE involved in copper resistance
MSLRTDYTGAIDTKLAAARTAGLSFVAVDNLADITTQMTVQADKGVKDFTLTFATTFQPDDLRLEGCLWEAYKSGIRQGLYAEDIMGNEVTVTLNTSDSVSTRVDLTFKF